MSEPIVYKITTEFVTDRTLEIEELVALAQSSYRKVVEPDADSMDEDEPYVVVDPVLRVWAGDNEIGGLNPKPVYHAYIAFYRAFQAGNEGTAHDDADEYLEEYFISQEHAELRSDFYLDHFDGETGSRIETGWRMISVPRDIYETIVTSPWRDIVDDDEYLARWRALDLWNPKYRVGEHLRYRILTRP
jgi:hypothetical protein